MSSPHMNSKMHSCFSKFHLLFIIKLLLLFQSSDVSSSRKEYYQTCGKTFSCGDYITGIGYPFRGASDPPYCGHPDLVLSCDFQRNVTTIDIMNIKYEVKDIHQNSQIMRIVREDVVQGTCPLDMVNTTLDHSLFSYTDACTNLTFLYGCDFVPNLPGLVTTTCQSGLHSVYVFPGTGGQGVCNASVVVPVIGNGAEGSLNAMELYQVIDQGFDIRWNIDSEACSNCTRSMGRCGFDIETSQTRCYCPDPPYVSGTCAMAYKASPTNRISSGIFSQDDYKEKF